MDDRKLEDLNVNWLRRQIGHVGWSTTDSLTLLNGTVRLNILLGKQYAAEEEMMTTMMLAAGSKQAAHRRIACPRVCHGIEQRLRQIRTYIGPPGGRGQRLPGGQKQRIAVIARAMHPSSFQNPGSCSTKRLLRPCWTMRVKKTPGASVGVGWIDEL
jgi:ABC-type multidrug transport system fused ATPase/permease subunit